MHVGGTTLPCMIRIGYTLRDDCALTLYMKKLFGFCMLLLDRHANTIQESQERFIQKEFKIKNI